MAVLYVFEILWVTLSLKLTRTASGKPKLAPNKRASLISSRG